MSWIHTYFVFVSISCFLDFQGCDSSHQPKTTYISPLEKFVHTIEQSLKTGSGFIDVITKIPVLKDLFDGEHGKTNTSIGSVLNPYKVQIKAIFPGTYWCGDGDISPNGKDVGFFKDTDTCCKVHDSCPDIIPSNEEKYGLINNGIFSRLHCSCDEEFYNCLKEANSIVATDIGTTYFNVLRPQCFKLEYPIIGCRKRSSGQVTDGKCLEYELDTDKPQEVQWFDNPDFISI